MTHPYIPASEVEEREMLKAIGVGAFQDLLEPVPAGLRLTQPVNIPAARSELEVIRDMGAWASQNAANSRLACFIGGGLYDHYIPSVIDHVTMRSEFYTAYTPYQAEVSQGTLIAIYEFQTMVAELTGLPVANASLYDGGSATGEAGLLAFSVTNRRKLVVAGPFHPAYLQVLKTYVEAGGAEVVVDPVNRPQGDGVGAGVTDLDWLRSAVDDQTAAVFVQHPNFFGQLEKVEEIREISARHGALMVASVDLLTLGLLAPPSDYGADLAIGESQPLGIPMSFGGPVAGFFAASDKYVRHMPGRLVGETVDKDGRRAFTLTLQTREQHIRREKATSNICTNQTLLAHRATVYMSLLGPAGIRGVGEQCLFRSRHAAQQLAALEGFKPAFDGPFVKEFVVECPCPARLIVDGALQYNVLAGVDLGRFHPEWRNLLMVAVTEKRSAAEIDQLVHAVRKAAAAAAGGEGATVDNRLIFEISVPGHVGYSLPRLDVPEAPLEAILPAHFLRKSPPLLPEVAEPEVVRHFTNISTLNHHVDKDFYPLGSCTMKYNPKLNDKVAAMPGLGDIHPLAPEHTMQGALALLFELQTILAEITGLQAVTLQPAAGAQGELTGMLITRAYHRKRGEPGRNKVIIPDSAHGTNPATVRIAGMQVVEIKSDARGLVDLDALKKVLGPDTAAMMVTNPNTLGIFERDIQEITRLVHEAGGLMYMDGANMNAIAGQARPGDMGFDIMHLNLHKTFSQPHGGGGPGAGPVAVRADLEPFLPAPVVRRDGARYWFDEARPDTVGRLHAFHGNFGALVRTTAYIWALGGPGVERMTHMAIVNANYLMHRLKDIYDLAYPGPCMHEFVLSGRKLKAHGVRTMDLAKRLLDYGFYAPTVYFPLIVEEALMIEPTESETLQTMDRFVEAMKAIYREALETPDLVRNAPHTTPVRRPDEGRAARELKLRWRPAVV